MKRLNKIILVFLVITFLTLYGGWIFIHSEKFSKEASIKVSKILTEKAGANLSFSGVEFSLFPLSTTFKNVKVSKDDPELFNIQIEASDLEVAFSYSSFIASEPEINEVILRDGKVDLLIKKTSEKDIVLKELNTKKIFLAYNEIFTKIPVRLNIISLEKIQLSVDSTSLIVNSLSFAPQKNQARLKADVSNLAIAHNNKDFGPLEFSNIKVLGSLEKSEWKIDNLEINKGSNKVEFSGVAYNKGELLYLKSTGSVDANAADVLDFLKFLPKELASIKGLVKGKFEVSGVIDDPDGAISFEANSIDTEWIKLDTASGVVSKRRNLLFVQKLFAKKNEEVYFLKKSHPFFNLDNEKFTNFNFNLKLENAFTDTFLYSIKDSLGTVKGTVTGEVDISLFDDKATFSIKENTQVKNFRLTTTDGKKDILKNAGFTFSNSLITVNQDYSVKIDAALSMANSKISAKGKITSKDIDIMTTDSRIDMKAFGPISGINITGAGATKVRVSGPLENVVFDFNVDWNNFSIVDLNFGKAKADFSLGLKELILNVHSLEGVFNKTTYNASGNLGFEGKSEGMDFKIDFTNANFSDARKMLHLVFKNIKLPVEPEFNFKASYSIQGGYGLESLKVNGQMDGSELKAFNEEAEKISLNLSLDKKILNFKQIKINKSRGEIGANASVNLGTNYIELKGSSKGLRLRDFNFYRNLRLEYDGDVVVDFDGNGTADEFSSRFKTKVQNAFIGNMPAASSNAIFYLSSNDVVTNASLLAGKIKVDSLISFKTGVAAIKSSIETSDLREFLGVFSAHNMNDKKIQGIIKAQLNTQISLGSLGVRKFFLNVDQFELSRGDIRLAIDPRFNRIEVDEGVVKKWDFRLRDGKEFFISKGHNVSNGVIGLDHRFSLKSNLLEIAAGQIERITGTVKGTARILLDKKLSIKEFNLYGDDHSIKIRGAPGYITNFDYTITKNGESFEVSRMNGNYGEGEFKISGKVLFDDMYPLVSLSYQVERSTIPLFKRSSLLINSTGSLTGTDLPYKLNGKVLLMHGEFLDDPADLMKDEKVSIDEYKKYLPEKDFLGNKGLIDLNISFDTVNPITIKNNMAEIYIKGNGQITGGILSPEISTRLETVPNISKFKFKGHDFALNQGYVEIRDRGKNRVSDLKFTGVAKINEYDMKLDLSGSISKVNVDLSSEPALSKEDLLSLLTLGVTSDMSKNLEAGERRFVTTVGIGTLLVDQLKINEDLNASLGVKVSVQPEFKEDETTLIQGKSAVSEGSTSRLKSATKIKVDKQINKRVNVSLSSTVGGSLEQKQEMNINLNMNKNFSLEGIYEVKPAEDNNTTTPDSLGADLKWRKSF